MSAQRPRRAGCGSLALPVRHRGKLRHPLPRPDPAPDIPNAPNTTLMVDSQAQSVGTRHSPGSMAKAGTASITLDTYGHLFPSELEALANRERTQRGPAVVNLCRNCW
jgi:hypothetical protein